MQAIRTRYIGPTNTRGARVRADLGIPSHLGAVLFATPDATVTRPWDHSLTAEQNHKYAALALTQKVGWQYFDWFGAWFKHDMYWSVALRGTDGHVPKTAS